jgi:hypothetical protein
MSVPSEDGGYGEDHPLAIELPASVDGERAEERGEMSPRSAPTSIIGDEARPNDELEIEQVEILDENLQIAQEQVAQAEDAGNATAHGGESPSNFRRGSRNSGGSAVVPELDIQYPSPPPPPGSTFPGNGQQFVEDNGYSPLPERGVSVDAAAAEGNSTDMQFKLDSQGVIDLALAQHIIDNIGDLGVAKEMMTDAFGKLNDYMQVLIAKRDSARLGHEEIELQCRQAEATANEWERRNTILEEHLEMREAQLQASEATQDEVRIRLQEHEDLIAKMSAQSRELEESLAEARRLSFDLTEEAIKIDKTDPKNSGAIEAIEQGRRQSAQLGRTAHAANAVEKMLLIHGDRPGDRTLKAEFVANMSQIAGLSSITGTSVMEFPNSMMDAGKQDNLVRRAQSVVTAMSPLDKQEIIDEGGAEAIIARAATVFNELQCQHLFAVFVKHKTFKDLVAAYDDTLAEEHGRRKGLKNKESADWLRAQAAFDQRLIYAVVTTMTKHLSEVISNDAAGKNLDSDGSIRAMPHLLKTKSGERQKVANFILALPVKWPC